MSLPVATLKSIKQYLLTKGYEVFDTPCTFNIIYVEGMSVDGTINDDEFNQFNDLRLVVNHNFQEAGAWIATTEPGRFYTHNPMNQNGAARIAFGQYKAWKVGHHGNSEPHEALVQVEPVSVYRDKNKDGLRTGDSLQTGLFGINQHWGYDLPPENIGKASAGCLVGRSRSGHKQFMNIIKADIRYQRNNDFIFSTVIIPGDKLK